MSTSDPMRFATIAISLLVGGAAGCGAGTDCMRYSDCDQGLTCAYGHCVLPPSQDPGDTTIGDDAASSAAGDDSGSLSTADGSGWVPTAGDSGSAPDGDDSGSISSGDDSSFGSNDAPAE